ncbi:MAG: DUF2911 domain-containing protein [Gemmatimonadota bacterium]
MIRSGLWTLLLAIAVGACAEGGQEAGDPGAAGEQEALACQPSDAMPLEGRSSPYDSTTIDVGDGQAKVCYGRPSLRGRTMIGGEAVPYDTLWRTGANEPTTIHLNVPARIAGIEVDPGSYSLYTIPRERAEWTLIVNRSTSQWGVESGYTDEVRGQEVDRAQVVAEETESTIEQFTIRPAAGGLAMEWQDTRVRVPIEPAS